VPIETRIKSDAEPQFFGANGNDRTDEAMADYVDKLSIFVRVPSMEQCVPGLE
jgi:hypothetical protein